MDIGQIKANERSPEGLAWRLLIAAALVDKKFTSKKTPDWHCGFQDLREKVLPEGHPFYTTYFTLDFLWMMDRSAKGVGNIAIETYFRILPKPETTQGAIDFAQRIRDAVKDVLIQCGITEPKITCDPPYERNRPNVLNAPRQSRDDSTPTDPFLRENEAGIDILFTGAEWAKVRAELIRINGELVSPDIKSPPAAKRKIAQVGVAASPSPEPTPAAAEISDLPAVIIKPVLKMRKMQPAPDRGSFIRAVTQIGIDVERAEAMYDVLEHQHQELEQGFSGKPLPLFNYSESHNSGLLEELQKASGIGQDRYSEILGFGRGIFGAYHRGEHKQIEPLKVVSAVINGRLSLFSETILTTAGIDIRSIDEIISEIIGKGSKEERCVGKLMIALRDSHCVVGEGEITTWLKASKRSTEPKLLTLDEEVRLLGLASNKRLQAIERTSFPSDEEVTKFINGFSIEGPTQGKFHGFVCAAIADTHPQESFEKLCEEALKQESLPALLRNLRLNLCATQDGIMPWKTAKERGLYPKPLTSYILDAITGINHTTIIHFENDKKPTYPTDEHIGLLAKAFVPAAANGSTEEKIAKKLKELREITRNSRKTTPVPGADAAGATGTPSIEPDPTREPETVPPRS